MDAACIAWETALPFPSHPFVSLLFLPPLPTHPTPLSPPAHSSGVCLFLPVAVLLQLSPLLWFCFGACCAWWCLLFCVPGLGSCVLSPPAFPPFLSLFGLLVVCSLCLFSAFVVLSFVSPLFVVAGCPCSLPSFPLPPLVCVCETRYHIRFSLYFIKNCRGAEGDLQSSAQRSSLQASQEARIDHPCVPALTNLNF